MANSQTPPAQIPLFPIRGCILLPGEHLPLNVFEPRYLNMIDDAMASDRFIGIVQPGGGGSKEQPALLDVGCAGVIASHSETEDGRYLIVLQGVMRFDVTEEKDAQVPYRVAKADYSRFRADLSPEPLSGASSREDFMALLRKFFDHAGLQADWDSLSQAPVSMIADKVSMAAPFDEAAKQALLEAETPADRIATLSAMMRLALQSDDLPRA